jgi:hypothetical protein
MCRSIEETNDIGNRTRDLPAFSTVHQPTILPRASDLAPAGYRNPAVILTELSQLQRSTRKQIEDWKKMMAVDTALLAYDIVKRLPSSRRNQVSQS